MVLAGVGIDHQKLVELGNKYFSIVKSQTEKVDNQSMSNEKAMWIGGTVMVGRTRPIHIFNDVH
jgi:hypothetical protein